MPGITLHTFYFMFKDEVKKKNIEKILKQIGDIDDIHPYELVSLENITEEELNKILFTVLTNYCTLANISLDVMPTNAFALLDILLSNWQDTEYSQSFLHFLYCLYMDLFFQYGMGNVTFSKKSEKEEKEEKEFYIEYIGNKIQNIYTENLNEIEELRLITKFFLLQKDKKAGPLPYVRLSVTEDKIRELVAKKLESANIFYNRIRILKKDWGYLVQVDEHYNMIFDKNGQVISPLASCYGDTGSLYNTEIKEKCDHYGKNHVWASKGYIMVKELDQNHFMIPIVDDEGVGNYLFYVDENHKITRKDFIRGTFEGNILTLDRHLMETKQLLHYELKDEKNEYSFYSWEKGERTSDIWSNIIGPEHRDRLWVQLTEKFEYPDELALELIKHIQENQVYLATQTISSSDKKTCLNLICFIGVDGIPKTDLLYLAPDYSVKNYSLEKKEIGEVDLKRLYLQEIVNQKNQEIEENKKALVSNFLKMSTLESKEHPELTVHEGSSPNTYHL